MDIFSLVINFLNKSWTPMHIIVSLFEMNETIRQSMAMQFESLFLKFDLMHYVIAYVTTWYPWYRCCAPSLIMNCWIFLRFVKVHVLVMWCYKRWKRFCRFDIDECEKRTNISTKDNYMDKEIWEREARMGKDLHWSGMHWT